MLPSRVNWQPPPRCTSAWCRTRARSIRTYTYYLFDVGRPALWADRELACLLEFRRRANQGLPRKFQPASSVTSRCVQPRNPSPPCPLPRFSLRLRPQPLRPLPLRKLHQFPKHGRPLSVPVPPLCAPPLFLLRHFLPCLCALSVPPALPPLLLPPPVALTHLLPTRVINARLLISSLLLSLLTPHSRLPSYIPSLQRSTIVSGAVNAA